MCFARLQNVKARLIHALIKGMDEFIELDTEEARQVSACQCPFIFPKLSHSRSNDPAFGPRSCMDMLGVS